jgi:signal transduction histidine kinase/predicted RNA-binding protein with RPS1 domain/FixJ family two-component response regulator
MTLKSQSAAKPGDRVEAKVLRHISGGLLVEVIGVGRGIVRNRELSWTRSRHTSQVRLSEGTRLELIVLNVKEDGFLELSRKRTDKDPWEKVREGRYRERDIVAGEVVNIQDFGAFIEIEPGIEGLLPKSEIPTGEFKKIQDLLWIGDYTEVCIREIKVGGRRMSLSIEERLRERQCKQADKSADTGLPRVYDSQEQDQKTRVPLIRQRMLGQAVRQILIVDDEVEFAAGFAEWLERLGYEVDVVNTAREAKSLKLDYDLLFIDVDLEDFSGLDLAAYFLDESPYVEIALMTGMSWDDIVGEIPWNLQMALPLLKPLDYDRIVDLLESLEESSVQRVSLRKSALRERDSEFLSIISEPLQQYQDLEASLENVLAALRHESRARAAIIFGVDPFTHRVSKLASSGSKVADLDMETLQSLRFSPVKDVALEEERIVEAWDIGPRNKQFDRLFELLFYFNACIAFPIPSVGLDIRYALFLIDPIDLDPGEPQTLREHRARVFSATQLVAAMVQEEHLRSLIGRTQSVSLTGQLASGLLHEVRNKINRVEQHAQIMNLDCQDFGEKPDKRSLSSWRDCFSQRVERILEANSQLRELAHEYLGLLRKERLEKVNVNEILVRTVRQVSPLARETKVIVETQFASELPPLNTVPLRLEQVFLNVALNAVQQMSLPSVDGNRLLIASTYESEDKEYPFKIRFKDEGPGIHGKLWSWIFEMGTSTREGGAGLGLFGSRRLLNSIGGRISVESSYMFVSSTFLIELPLDLMLEVTDV